MYLNRNGRLLDDALIAQGVPDSVRPPLRTVVARALQVNATALIAGHNHPSGRAEPSESDRLLTSDLIAACRPLGLRVLDHVIVGEETFSFADSGLLDELELECLAPGAAWPKEEGAGGVGTMTPEQRQEIIRAAGTRRGAFAGVGADPLPAGKARI